MERLGLAPKSCFLKLWATMETIARYRSSFVLGRSTEQNSSYVSNYCVTAQDRKTHFNDLFEFWLLSLCQ